jgi:hypothetical protein
MNFFSQGRSVGDADPEFKPHQSTSNERPGKFPDLSKFMVIDKGCQLKYLPGTQAPVDPGHIVYIKDTSREDSRINDRVMLVLFHNRPFTYTCLSFCCHSDFSGETLHNSHALVFTDQDQQAAPQPSQTQQSNASLPCIEIKLHLNTTPFSLRPDIYLNLREHWNVEQEVQLVVLGRVEQNSYYEKLVPEIKRLFCQSLDGSDIVRDSGNPPVSNRQESASPERKNSNRKDKVYVRRRKHSMSHWPISSSYQQG